VHLKSLEIWADSFKEGEWFLENVGSNYFPENYSVHYRYNFQPIFRFHVDDNTEFEAIVFGPYRNWKPNPPAIKKVLGFGKPDVVLYDRNLDQILLAVEETAAVPTGNQSLQRLERVCFAAEQGIPFVYLISEYGLHKDGGIRRSSIWPSYLALKLSSQYKVMSVTLFYSDASHPEDYSVGSGVNYLAEISYLVIAEWLGNDVIDRKKRVLERSFSEMGEFILDQYSEISPHLPGCELLYDQQFHKLLVERTIQ
jgi:hypothetical protein